MIEQRYQQYEIQKAAWVVSHPHTTPEEYQAAMRRIAEKCGV